MSEDWHSTARRSGRFIALLVVVGALATWAATLLLVSAIVPLLIAEPNNAASAGEIAAGIYVFAATGALAEVGIVAGLAATWRMPRRALGRVVLLVAGLIVALTGLIIGNVGVFDLAWTGWAAFLGLTSAALQLSGGVVACLASISNALPGPSLIERMMLPPGTPPTAATRPRMLALSSFFAAAWIALAAGFLAMHDPGTFMTLQWLMPVLMGMLVVGWRASDRNRFRTLGFAAAAGMANDLLFLVVLVVAHYYRFNPAGFGVWWAAMGGLFGALGYGLTFLAPTPWLVGRRLGRSADPTTTSPV